MRTIESIFTKTNLFFLFCCIEALLYARQEHLEEAAGERRKYRSHQRKAKNNPDKYMCMISDGITQKTTALPHFTTKPSWKGQDELGVHVEGIMVHNRAPHLGGLSNLTILA